MSEISVLVADSQLLFGDALAFALDRVPGLDVYPQRPQSGIELIDIVASRKPGVALVDFWLEGMDAGTVALAVLKRSPETKILHLAWFHGPGEIKVSLASGAVGFLSKGLRVSQVADVVKRAYIGESPIFDEELAEIARTSVVPVPRPRDPAERFAALSSRELEVLRLVGIGLAVEEVAARLGLSDRTIRTHVHQILNKVGVRSQLEAVKMARDHGLLR